MISLNYKCSKDAKTGLGLVRECLVQILSQYLETQLDGQSSCTCTTFRIHYFVFNIKQWYNNHHAQQQHQLSLLFLVVNEGGLCRQFDSQ